MTFLIILLVAAAVLVAATVRQLIHDDRGTQRPPASHFEDPSFIAPLAR